MKKISVYKKTTPTSSLLLYVLITIPGLAVTLETIEFTLFAILIYTIIIFNIFFEILPKQSVNQKKEFEHSINKSSILSCRIELELELKKLLSRFVLVNYRYKIAKSKYSSIYLNDYFYQEYVSVKNEQKSLEIIEFLKNSCSGISKRTDFIVSQVCDSWEILLCSNKPKELYLLRIIQMQIILSLGYNDKEFAQNSFVCSLRFILEDYFGYSLHKNELKPINVHDFLSELAFSNLLQISLTGLTKVQVDIIKKQVKFVFLSDRNQTIPTNMFDLFRLINTVCYSGFSLDFKQKLDHADGIFLKNDEKTTEFKQNVDDLVERLFSFETIELYWESENRELAITH